MQCDGLIVHHWCVLQEMRAANHVKCSGCRMCLRELLAARRLHCTAASSARLHGFIACGRGDYTTLLWAAQGCRASLLAVIANTLRCCGRCRVVGLHCLRL